MNKNDKRDSPSGNGDGLSCLYAAACGVTNRQLVLAAAIYKNKPSIPEGNLKTKNNKSTK